MGKYIALCIMRLRALNCNRLYTVVYDCYCSGLMQEKYLLCKKFVLFLRTVVINSLNLHTESCTHSL
jgi:hypothetical protein